MYFRTSAMLIGQVILSAVFGTHLESAEAADVRPFVYQDFETSSGFSAAGDAAAERVEADAKQGRTCLKVRFGGIDDQVRVSLIQAPTMPELGQKVREAEATGIRLWIRGDGPRRRVQFRIQWRDPIQFKNIRGASQVLLSISGSEWKQVSIPFTELSPPPESSRWDATAFERYHPQLQFGRSGTEPYTIYLDQIEFTQVAPNSLVVEPDLPGRDWQPRIEREAASLPPTPPGRVPQSQAISTLRPRACLNGWWHMLPVHAGNETIADWKRNLVPGWYRDPNGAVATWYVRRFEIPRTFTNRTLKIEFGAVGMYAEVFLNGQPIGKHAGAYTPFSCDATDAARVGELNTLSVYVRDETYAIVDGVGLHQVSSTPLLRKNREVKNGRGGIWQDVMLQGYPEVSIANVQVTTSTRKKSLEVRLELANTFGEERPLSISGRCVPIGDSNSELAFQFPPITVRPRTLQTESTTETWANPSMWSPEAPNLYWLELEVRRGDVVVDRTRTRFGFREFWIEGEHFMLNGVPIRLRGDSHIAAHSYQSIMHRKDFMKAVFRAAKETTRFNAARVHAAIGHPAIYEAADEVGVLLIDQSSIWSIGASFYRRGGTQFLANTKHEFAEWVRRDRNHPSVVIWDVENEMVRGNTDHWDWAKHLDQFVLEHDRSRPIEHSGAGYSLGNASIYHIHHNENYTMLYEAWEKSEASDAKKPMIAGEWWVGGRSGEHRLTTGEEFFSSDDYRRRELALIKERIDEQRCFGLSGIMPFVWLTSYFEPILESPPTLQWKDPAAPGVKPDRGPRNFDGWRDGNLCYRVKESYADCLRRGLGPLFVCVREKWTTVWSEEALDKTLVVANDSERPVELSVRWTLGADGAKVEQRVSLALIPGEIRHLPVDMTVPGVGCPTDVPLRVELWQADKLVNWDEQQLIVYPKSAPPTNATDRPIYVYAPRGSTLSILKQLGLSVETIDSFESLDSGRLLVIGRGAVDERFTAASRTIASFVENGGRVLCFEQQRAFDWLPYPIGFQSMLMTTPPAFEGLGLPPDNRGINFSRTGVIQSPQHPAFDGIVGDRLDWWRGADGRVAGDLMVKPTADADGRAIPFRALVGGTRIEYASLAEVMHGAGRYTLCQAQVTDNFGFDPVATRLLHNLVSHGLADPAPRPKVLTVGKQLHDFFQDTLKVDVPNATSLPTTNPNADILLLGPDVQLPLQETETLRHFLARGGQAVWIAPETLPQLAAVHPNPLPNGRLANHVEVAERGWFFAGLNAFDLSYWSHATPSLLDISSKSDVAPLLHASTLPVRTGATKGLDVKAMRPLGVVATSTRIGEGELVVTSLPLLADDDPRVIAVWGTLLVNLGIGRRAEQLHETWKASIVEHVAIDGNLQEWISDMEDRNVSNWIHATPHLLTATEDDNREAVGLVYLGLDPRYLYLVAQLTDDQWSEQDRLLCDFGSSRIDCTWNQQGRPVVCDEQGRPIPGVAAAGRDASDSAHNPDLSQLSDTTSSATRNSGRTLEIAIPRDLVALHAMSPGIESGTLIVRYQDHDAGRSTATHAFPPSGSGVPITISH